MLAAALALVGDRAAGLIPLDLSVLIAEERIDDQAALALGVLAEGDDTVNVCHDAGILGLLGLKELGNARQTSGNILVSGNLLRYTVNDVARMDLLVLLQLDYGVVAERVALDDSAVSIPDDDDRVLRILALLADLADLNGLDSGCGILLEVNVDSVVHVLELNST